MHVAMYYNNQDIRLEEMPIPRIGPGEFLLPVRVNGDQGESKIEARTELNSLSLLREVLPC